jgi:hypothetical protein
MITMILHSALLKVDLKVYFLRSQAKAEDFHASKRSEVLILAQVRASKRLPTRIVKINHYFSNSTEDGNKQIT